MARNVCDVRILLVVAGAAFIFIQVRLFATQSEYADRLAATVESESQCTSQMRLLIDQISVQQGKIVALEEAKRLQDLESAHLKALVQDLERKGLNILIGKKEMPVAAVVIMACSRPDYLERTIESVLKYQRSVASKFPLFISQDGTDQNVKSKALSYSQITYMQHLNFERVRTERPGELTAYYKIARHYKWALDELFIKNNFSRVIILEDDMEIAPDFFDYFEATTALLDKDKSIMAVSSWNDNGQVQFVHDPETLYRSDFFPGLGWMLTKSTWEELSPKWPKAYWDDWVRLKEVHKGRQFIRPEVCRTYNFGEHAIALLEEISVGDIETRSLSFESVSTFYSPYAMFPDPRHGLIDISFKIQEKSWSNIQGASMGQFFKQYLEPIKLNDVHVDWKAVDLSYLMEDKFLKRFAKLVSDAKPVHEPDSVLKAYNIDGDVRIQYRDQEDFEYIARKFGIFEEWKDGIPRTAYKGVVVFRHQTSRRIFLVGPDSLRQLGIEQA